MLIDYKFNYIREINGTFEAKVSIYSGDFQDVLEKKVLVNRYVRDQKIGEKIISGNIEDLKSLFNEELTKYTAFTPINEQKISK